MPDMKPWADSSWCPHRYHCFLMHTLLLVERRDIKHAAQREFELIFT